MSLCLLADDFGIEEVLLQYRTIKPYYLDQDTTLNEILIFNKIKENIKDKYLNYSWDISNLNIGPGDEIEFWIKAYDNNNITGPGIGI